MKYALSILTFLLAAPAFAQVHFLNELNPKLPKIQITKGTSGSQATVVPPIRMARLKAQISKITVIDNGNGTWGESTQIVCTKEINTPVFDLRNADWGDGTEGKMECLSTLNGQPVTVRLSSVIILLNGQVFENEAAADFKYASAFLTVPGNGGVDASAYYVGGARGIDANSFIGWMGGEIHRTCISDSNGNVTCSVNSPQESFAATVEFIDQ